MQLSNRSFQPVSTSSYSHTRLSHQFVYQHTHYQSLIDQLTSALRNTSDLEQIFQLAVDGVVAALQVSRCLVILLKYQNPLHKVQSHRSPAVKATVAALAPFACDLSAPRRSLTALSSSDSPYSEFSEGTWLNYSFPLSDCALCQSVWSETDQPVVVPQLASPNFEDSVDPSWLVDDCSLISESTGERSPQPFSLTPQQKAACNTPNAVAPILNLSDMPALMLIPLEHQGSILGYLVVQHHQPCPWQLEEFTFVRLVAAQIGTAIIQTHTLQQVQALVEERTTQLQRSLDVQAKLYNKTRQQIRQLQELNRLKDEFLSTMSHELRTPLTSMMLAIRMLREAELSPERRTKYLDVLEQQCVQETKLINDLLALQKLETGTVSLEVQTVDVRRFIQDFTQMQHGLLVNKDLQLELELPASPLTIQTDLDSLTRILTELFSNACKYSLPGTTIGLTVEATPSSPTRKARQIELFNTASVVYFSLRSVGPGISAEEIPLIFDKFRRGRGMTDRAVPGTGLGLALVKGLVEHLNGSITAKSHPLADDEPQVEAWETCFTVAIPRSPQ